MKKNVTDMAVSTKIGNRRLESLFPAIYKRNSPTAGAISRLAYNRQALKTMQRAKVRQLESNIPIGSNQPGFHASWSNKVTPTAGDAIKPGQTRYHMPNISPRKTYLQVSAICRWEPTGRTLFPNI